MRTLILLFAAALAIAPRLGAQNEPLKASGRRDPFVGLQDRVVLEFKVTTRMTLGRRGDLQGVAVCYPGTRNRVWNTFIDIRGDASISVRPGKYDIIVFGDYGEEAFMRSVDVSGFTPGDIIPVKLNVDRWDSAPNRTRTDTPATAPSRTEEPDPEIAALRRRLRQESEEAEGSRSEMKKRLDRDEAEANRLRTDMRRRTQQDEEEAERRRIVLRKQAQEEEAEAERRRKVILSGGAYSSRPETPQAPQAGPAPEQSPTQASRKLEQDDGTAELRRRLQQESQEADRQRAEMKRRMQREDEEAAQRRQALRSGTRYTPPAQEPAAKAPQESRSSSDDLSARLRREEEEAEQRRLAMRRQMQQEEEEAERRRIALRKQAQEEEAEIERRRRAFRDGGTYTPPAANPQPEPPQQAQPARPPAQKSPQPTRPVQPDQPSAPSRPVVDGSANRVINIDDFDRGAYKSPALPKPAPKAPTADTQPTQPEPIEQPEEPAPIKQPAEPEQLNLGNARSFSLRIFEAYRFSDGATLKSGDTTADLHFYYVVRSGKLNIYLAGDRIKEFSGQPNPSWFTSASVRSWADQVYGPAPGYYGLKTSKGQLLLLHLDTYDNQGKGPAQWKMNFTWQPVN